MSSIEHMVQACTQQQMYSILCALGKNTEPLWALVYSGVKGRPSDLPLNTDCEKEKKGWGKCILETNCLCIH